MKYILPNKSLLDKTNDNLDKEYYCLGKLVYHKDFKDNLVIPIGIDDNKEKYYLDLKKVSGLLITGETGSGKSIYVHSIIISLLLKNNPDDLKFILGDLRKVELNNYNMLPHLYMNILSSDIDIKYGLNEVINILEERKKIFKNNKVDNIDEYNLNSDLKLSNIIVIIDEIGNLINSKYVLDILNKILDDCYKYGIHFILATSSYLKKIKDNKLVNKFNYILSFDLASNEQASILKIKGSDLLSIEGDALVKCRNNEIINLQTPYVSLEDIENVIKFIKNNN